MGRPLVGARVQRVDVGYLDGREVALLRIRVRQGTPAATASESVHFIIAAGMGAGVVDASERTRVRGCFQGAASPTQAQWRASVEGGRVTGFGPWGLAFDRDGRHWCFTQGPSSDRSRRSLCLRPIPRCAPACGAPSADPPRQLALAEQMGAPPDPIDGEALEKHGRRIVDELARAGRTARREALGRALAKALGKVERRVEAVRGDLARMKDAAAAAEIAQLFVAEAARAPRGTTKLKAVDWSSGEARPIEMAIDPARDARTQIDALFKRARRLKQAAPIVLARLADAERARAGLAALAEALRSQVDADLGALETTARAAAPRDFRSLFAPVPSLRSGVRRAFLFAPDPSLRSGVRRAFLFAPDPSLRSGVRRALEPGANPSPGRESRSKGTPRPPHRTFLTESGARLLVGRGAAHNDALTFRIARPHDLWLHAKNRAGAHVIVPLDKGESCPADLLVQAAHLAAHFSDARDERVVEVEHTPRRYLRKPRGSAPGMVVVSREKVIVLRRQDELLRKLLEREAEG